MTDIVMQLMCLFLTLAAWLQIEWSESEEVAAQVPDMKGQIIVLDEQRKDGERKYKKAKEEGDKLKSLIDGKDGELSDMKGTIGQMASVIDGQDEKLGELNGTVGKMAAVIGSQKKRIGGLTGRVGELLDENGQYLARHRSGDALTVVVLMDVTASLGEDIANLQSSMAAAFEIVPNTSKDFRVGVLAFRRGVVARFPITRIFPTYEDDARSQKAVLAFLDTLKAEHGYTSHLPVFREGFAMLKAAHPKHDPKRQLRMIFLGDIGPSELDTRPGYNAAERQMKDRLLRGVQEWAKRSKGQGAVKAFYAESTFTQKDPSAAESRQWFKDLGSVSPKSGFFTDSNALLRAIVHDSLK